MREEIFGPLLPLLPYDRLDDAIAFINARAAPAGAVLVRPGQQPHRARRCASCRPAA